MSDGLALSSDFEASDAMVSVSPLIRRIVAPNAGPMTFRGTNTYVVGHKTVAIIDPGPALPAHVEAILAGLAGETIAHIVVTHTHRDHSPAARLLKERTGAPIVGCGPHRSYREPLEAEQDFVKRANDLDHAPDHVFTDGDRLDGDGFSLVAISTPGHTMNHLAFALPEEHAVFTGDHVMAWSTTVIAPPGGSMSAYMDSLERLRGRDDTVYWPGHGGPVRDPQRFVRALQHHRRQRESGILSRLRAGDETIDAIVAATYEKLDPRLASAAALSVLSHLEDLHAKGRVTVDGGLGRYARFALQT